MLPCVSLPFRQRFGYRFGYNQIVPKLVISLLGPPIITVNGAEFDTERRKAIAILAYLAVTGRRQPREHLAAFFWPDYDRDSAFSYLRRELYEINNNLGKGWLTSDRRNAGLDLSTDISLDVAAFEADLADSRVVNDPVGSLERAVERYRGDFLSGFYLADTEPFEDWQRQQAEAYRRDYAGALERLASVHEQRGMWPAAMKSAQAWLALDDLNEAAHRAVMRIFAGMGERSSAIRQYEICRQELTEELGVEPQAETTALYERIAGDRFEVSAVPIEEPQAQASKVRVHLPVLTTPFIGRRPELEQIKEQVLRRDNRLVTLMGPGGTGKTRLSIQAAAELGDRFTDGIWFAPLAPVRSPEEIVTAMAASLHFSFHRDEEQPRRQLLDYLHEKEMLVILDNVEHLVGEEACELFADILTSAEAVKLLVTTRVRLNIPGEQLFPVSGMRLPEPEDAAAWTDPASQSLPFSAIQLFLDRAQRVQPGFVLDTANAAAVAEICKLVDGIPLGIELAASWLELLPPEEIAREIRRSIDFLETDQPGVPERQRSIRAVFDYSWKLLNEIERNAFITLTVFVGSFSPEVGREVSEASLRTLLSLANKSWLQQVADGRFALHPLLQHYGSERLRADLDVCQQAHERHALYFARFVGEMADLLRGPGQLSALEKLAVEYNTNIRSAWYWLIENGHWQPVVEQMATGLFLFGSLRYRGDELFSWYRDARMKLEETAPEEEFAWILLSTMEVSFEEQWGLKENLPTERIDRIWNLARKKRLARRLGLWYVQLGNLYLSRNPNPAADAELAAFVDELRTLGDEWAYAYALIIGSNYWDGLLMERPEDVLLEALSIFKRLGTYYEQGIIIQSLAVNATAREDPIEKIIDLYEQAQVFSLKMNDYIGSALIHWKLSDLYFMRGIPEHGFHELSEARRIFENFGRQRMVGNALSWESLWSARFGTKDQALEVRRKSLIHNQKFSFRIYEYWDYYELAETYRIFGEEETAGKLVDQAELNFKQLNFSHGLGYCERLRGDLAMLEARFADALAYYRGYASYVTQDNHQWSLMQAYARQAWAQAHLGDVAAARQNIHACLNRLVDSSVHELEFFAFLAEVRCLMVEEKYEEAASLAAFILSSKYTWNEHRTHAQALLDEIRPSLSPTVFEAASSRIDQRDVRQMVRDWIAKFGMK